MKYPSASNLWAFTIKWNHLSAVNRVVVLHQNELATFLHVVYEWSTLFALCCWCCIEAVESCSAALFQQIWGSLICRGAYFPCAVYKWYIIKTEAVGSWFTVLTGFPMFCWSLSFWDRSREPQNRSRGIAQVFGISLWAVVYGSGDQPTPATSVPNIIAIVMV